MRLVIPLLVCLMCVNISFAQTDSTSTSTYNPDDYDIFDGLRRKKIEKMKAEGTYEAYLEEQQNKKEKNLYVIGAPFVGYNPFLGVAIGVGGNASFRLGDKSNTRLSNFVPLYTWTTNRQQIARVNSTIYTNEDKFYLFSSLFWSISPQLTYGLGTNSPEDWQTAIEPYTLKAIFRGYKKVKKDLYIGLNYQLDYKYKLVNSTGVDMQEIIANGQSNDQSAADVQAQMQSEYGRFDSYWDYREIDQSGFEQDYPTSSPEELQKKYYSTPFDDYEYGTTDSYVYSALGANFLYDSRDNVNCAYEGYYANLLVNFNNKAFGADYNSTNIYLDLRHYFKLRPDNRQILAVWGLANLNFGETPYLNLSRIGGDDWYASGRGYTAARYIGEQLLYLEAEYRVNMYKWFGMTFFANTTTTTGDDGKFQGMAPGAGIGLRIKAMKASRTNICLDLGVGKEGSTGFYARFIEAF